MDKEHLYLDILAETYGDRHNSEDMNDEEKIRHFHFKSFIQIMATLKEILHNQDQIMATQTEILSSNNTTEIKTKLNEVNIQIKKINDSLCILMENKKAWKRVWEKVAIYFAAVASVITLLALANQFGFFQIVWSVKK